MIPELTVGVVLTASGLGVLAPFREKLSTPAWMWLSLPIGAAVYLLLALGVVLISGSLDPGLALALLGVIGLVVGLAGTRLTTWDSRVLLWVATALALTIVTVIVARAGNLTRLTPDSVRYLLFSTDLLRPEALSEVHPADLLKRQMGLPSLQALSDLTDRRYLSSIGPLFGVFGLGYFTWFVWDATSSLTASRRRFLATTAVLFLVASNRLLYDVFYINTHIELAAYLLIAVTGAWKAITERRWQWAVPAGVSLGAAMMFRPDSPLFVAVVLIALAMFETDRPTKLLMTGPTLLAGFLWYGLVLWDMAPGGDSISRTAPVFINLVAVSIAAMILSVSDADALRALKPYTGRAMIGGLLTVLFVLAVGNPEIVIESVWATAQNVAYRGLWLLTWTVAIPLTIVALIVHRIPSGRLWTTSIASFAILFWILPLARDGAWRLGIGDSGNRILAHFLPIVVAFLVLAAVEHWPDAMSGEIPDPEEEGEELERAA